MSDEPAYQLAAFRELVLRRGAELYRDLPWRDDREPYGVWLSEVMLQQTQVGRVISYWENWLQRFPTVDALAAAPVQSVLESWQGLGYNRRCLALKRSAEMISEQFGGDIPVGHDDLVSLPGIGPATAAGIRVFAYGLPDLYLETNVRAVFLHELFPDAVGVPDKVLEPLIVETCPEEDPATWYYALLDYGAYLKKTVPNPSRRSAGHTTQSRFEGSRRQKRAWLLRAVMDAPAGSDELAERLSSVEVGAGRPPVDTGTVEAILGELCDDGFLQKGDGTWRVGG
jgi:A/G-specific adenine glycosylase